MFIDDNTTNLQEVLFYNPGIQISDPSIISCILSNPLFEGKNDINLSRLKQYKVLERKAEDETKNFWQVLISKWRLLKIIW